MKTRRGTEISPEVEAWRARCPIRLWIDDIPRKRSDRLRKIRDTFGVTKASVYNWMWGKTLPTSDKFPAICKMVGVSPGGYIKWFNDYPTEKAPCAPPDPDEDEDSD